MPSQKRLAYFCIYDIHGNKNSSFPEPAATPTCPFSDNGDGEVRRGQRGRVFPFFVHRSISESETYLVKPTSDPQTMSPGSDSSQADIAIHIY